MPISMATKLGIQFARFAAASGNAGTSGLRGALNNAASGSSSATSSWTQGLSSGGASSANGAGIGGAKFHAGRGAHSSFQQSGRALANANATSSNDGSNSIGDDDEDFAAQQARIHRPGQLHRSALIGRHVSQSHARLVRSKRETYITSLPALQLILPRAEHTLLNSSASPAHVRTLTNDASTSSPLPNNEILPPTEDKPAQKVEDADQRPTKTVQHRRHGRSHSMSATYGRQKGLIGKNAMTDLESMLDDASRPSSPIRVEESQIWSPEEKLLTQAIQENDIQKMKRAVQTYRKLDPSRQSLQGFNKALQALLQIFRSDPEKETMNIVSTYLQMIEADKRPNGLTWSLVTIALCDRDSHLNPTKNKEIDDQSFDQAFSLFKLAHASHEGGGYMFVSPYNKLLMCCSIRGDTKKACDIFQHLIANRHVTLNLLTFKWLMSCFAKDQTKVENESEQEKDARILHSTQQIFDTFERKRLGGSFDTDNDPEFGAVIWNNMIKIRFDRNDTPGALMMIEKMLTDTSAPNPTPLTSENIIKVLVNKGEYEDAMKWLNKIIDSHMEPKTDIVHPILPLPVLAYPAINSGIKASVKDMPLVQILYRLATGSIDISRNTNLDETRRKNLLDSTRTALLANGHIFKDAFRKKNMEVAATLIDSSLQLISKHAEVNDVTAENVIFSAELIQDSRRFANSILNHVVQPLYELRRFQDAASALTYAIHYYLLLPEVRSRFAIEEHGQLSEVVFDVQDTTMLMMGDIPHYHHKNITEEPLNASEIEQYALQMLIASVQILVPMFEPLGQGLTSQYIQGRVISLYGIVRGQIPAEQLPFSSKDWSTLVNIFSSREIAQDAGFERESGCLILLQDLGKLPREIIQEIDLTRIGTIVMRKYPSDAKTILSFTDPSLAQQLTESAPDAIASPDDGSNADAISEATTTTLTFESILDGFTSPPSSIGESVAQQVYPPVQVIDEDLCADLLVQNAGSRRTKFAEARPSDPNGAYERLMTSISDSGRYPTIKSIGAMMVTAGRNGNLDRIQQLYVIGCHVVASLVGDLDWQQWSWALLENEMITGLAHAGEAKAASDHRHRLINAGHIPTANAYAALVTVVRDTTDDAIIAEELYQESQRLGVEPNVFLFNTVISKLCRARKLERAMQLFDEMRQRGLNPSSVTYGALINGCTRIGDEAKAEELFALMESDRHFKPQAPPFNTMMQFYVHSQPNRSKAFHYFNKLLQHNVVPTTHTYKILLDACGTIEPVDIAGMQDIFGQLIAARNVNVDGAHWASIITAHGIHCQDLQKAIEIFDSIPNHIATKKSKNKLPDALTYEAILNVFLTHNRIDLMQTYFNKLRQDGIQPTAYLANLMIRGLAVDQGVATARELFAEMHDPPMGVAAFGNHPPNHRHHANGIHHKSHESYSTSDGLYGFQNVLREPSTFEAMIKVEMQYGQKDNAIVLLDRMKERGYPPALITKASSLLTTDANQAIDQQVPN